MNQLCINKGPFGSFFLYLNEHYLELIRFVWYASVVVHLGEALCALTFCIYLGVDGPNTARWVWSGCLYGGFSLRYLIKRLYHDELGRKGKPYDVAKDIAKMQ